MALSYLNIRTCMQGPYSQQMPLRPMCARLQHHAVLCSVAPIPDALSSVCARLCVCVCACVRACSIIQDLIMPQKWDVVVTCVNHN